MLTILLGFLERTEALSAQPRNLTPTKDGYGLKSAKITSFFTAYMRMVAGSFDLPF